MRTGEVCKRSLVLRNITPAPPERVGLLFLPVCRKVDEIVSKTIQVSVRDRPQVLTRCGANGDATVLDTEMCRFESCHRDYPSVAQLEDAVDLKPTQYRFDACQGDIRWIKA